MWITPPNILVKKSNKKQRKKIKKTKIEILNETFTLTTPFKDKLLNLFFSTEAKSYKQRVLKFELFTVTHLFCVPIKK